ncbi:MAG: LytR C-terminal domain-containing protein, partial [Leptospiraceae bacterium]|nr:LytR C-terminal domain-containing protein [Leptospiraceae bacterium]
EKITNLNVNYSFLVKEKDFIRFLNIIGGIQFFFDPSIFVSDDIYKRNSGDYKLYGKEIIDFLRLPEKPEPMDYLNRLNRQESIILSIYDRIKELTEFRKEWITHFENKITTELIGEELYSLFDFINKEKIVFSIKELPVEPFTPEKSEREFLLAKQDSGKITFQKLKKFLEAEDYKYGELVRSEILNSTDKNGLAKSVKSILNEKRIKVLTVGNGWNSNEKFSVVIDRSGNSEFSYKIANILGIKKVRHIIDKELGLDTTVLLGEDFEIKPRK